MPNHRFHVYHGQRLVAVIHALNPDEAVIVACDKTRSGYDPHECRAQLIERRQRAIKMGTPFGIPRSRLCR